MRPTIMLVPALACAAALAQAQAPAPAQPSVTVAASATATITNDRLQAFLRAEAENASASAAASQVNAAIAKALADAKAYPSIKVATAGYSTYQVSDKAKAQRWHVVQTISLEAGDFTAAATPKTALRNRRSRPGSSARNRPRRGSGSRRGARDASPCRRTTAGASIRWRARRRWERPQPRRRSPWKPERPTSPFR